MIYTAQELKRVANNVRGIPFMDLFAEAARTGQTSWRGELGMKPAFGQQMKQRLEALGYVVTVHGQREDEVEGTVFDVEVSWNI